MIQGLWDGCSRTLPISQCPQQLLRSPRSLLPPHELHLDLVPSHFRSDQELKAHLNSRLTGSAVNLPLDFPVINPMLPT